MGYQGYGRDEFRCRGSLARKDSRRRLRIEFHYSRIDPGQTYFAKIPLGGIIQSFMELFVRYSAVADYLQ
jgi:hypothetical protein